MMELFGGKTRTALAAAAALMFAVYVIPRALNAVVPPDLLFLPVLLFFSFYRMLIAYALSLVFSLAYGYYAATNEGLSRILLPALDVLQSVPILGFFPAAVFVLINTFQGSSIGIELAAIFLIFTSMAWNMTFGVYESITAIPRELRYAVGSFGMKRFRNFKALHLPACIPKLVYNSTVSWANGWYFLIASEIISLGSARHTLPGIGSYLVETTARGDIPHALAGFGLLVLLILGMEFLPWRPLSVWSEKFRYDSVSGARPSSRVYRYVKWSPFFIGARKGISSWFEAVTDDLESVADWLDAASKEGKYRLTFRAVKFGAAALAVVVVGGIVFEVAKLAASFFLEPLPEKAYLIPAALAASFAKLLVAYAISLLWILPTVALMAKRSALESKLMPFFEVVAAIPTTALFPFMALVAVGLAGDFTLATIVLILTGMQWYLLFNALAGARSLPKDMNEVARAFRIDGSLYWRKVLVPAMVPSLITGSVTAFGGGWNILVVAEYLEYGDRTFTSFGIGQLLSEATYKLGDMRLIALTLIGMVSVIFVINHFVWRRLYSWASRRFAVDY
ncbi:MAG: ABC transporter permease subunit [Candidatus Micrarchaeota archaeon]